MCVLQTIPGPMMMPLGLHSPDLALLSMEGSQLPNRRASDCRGCIESRRTTTRKILARDHQADIRSEQVENVPAHQSCRRNEGQLHNWSQRGYPGTTYARQTPLLAASVPSAVAASRMVAPASHNPIPVSIERRARSNSLPVRTIKISTIHGYSRNIEPNRR